MFLFFLFSSIWLSLTIFNSLYFPSHIHTISFSPFLSSLSFFLSFFQLVFVFFFMITSLSLSLPLSLFFLHSLLFFSREICRWGLEYTDCILCKGVRPTSKYLSSVWWWGWRSGECGVLLHCHYSQVNSDPVRVLSIDQIDLFKIIHIW